MTTSTATELNTTSVATLEEAIQNAERAVKRFNQEYILNGDINKEGMCGFGIVLIQFGRKSKLRKEADNYLNDEWSGYGKKTYVFSVPSIHVLKTQNYDYHEGLADVVSKELGMYYSQFNVPVISHTWVD